MDEGTQCLLVLGAGCGIAAAIIAFFEQHLRHKLEERVRKLENMHKEGD